MEPVPSSLSAREAARIAAATTGSPVVSCDRFPTGLRHWVYDVELEDSSQLVVRLSHPDHRDELAGGLFWRERLVSVGVSVPDLIAADVDAAQPYMVLERLAGTDLGNVFDELDDPELVSIAATVADFQAKTAKLEEATGYGYALNDRTPLQDSWFGVLEQSISRAEERIDAAGVVDLTWVGMTRDALEAAKGSLNSIEPTAFLHDATTKNVIVDGGMVTGIVDTDEMAFGDPLWAAALTRMSLLAARRPTRYADLLIEAHGDAERVYLYTAIFALDFLSELGQQFNRDVAAPTSAGEIELLTSVLTEALNAAGPGV